MNWFLIALSAPALWAASSHIDKYLLEKYFKHQGIGALLIFSGLIYLFILPVFLLIQPRVLDIPLFQAGILVAGGIIEVFGFLIYLYAIEKDEASVVIPIFQVMPVIAYIFGYFILGETLTEKQIWGSLLIIIGAIVISLDLTQIKTSFKTRVFFLILLASVIFSLNGAIFKFVAITEDFWVSNFWASTGDSIMGLAFFAFVGNYRRQFIALFRTNAAKVIGINVSNELITLGSGLLFRYAILLAPLALVQTVNGFQPFFVFLFGIILTLFFPKLGRETLSKKIIFQKLTAIAIMFVGTYIINT